jgi:hypothetical protein
VYIAILARPCCEARRRVGFASCRAFIGRAVRL